MKRLSQWIYVSSLAVMLSGQSMFAQSVIFSQEEQPGKAVLKFRKGVYTLSNDLLRAEFKEDGGKQVFGGCKALNLLRDRICLR